MNAVDTNIVLYALDTKEPVKQAKAAQLLRQLAAGAEPTVLFWQVLAESIQQLRRWKNLGDITETEFELHVQSCRNIFPLILPTIDVLDHALVMAKRFSLSHWDSMILGACKAAGVNVLYTEDMGSPTVFDGVQLVNPLT